MTPAVEYLERHLDDDCQPTTSADQDAALYRGYWRSNGVFMGPIFSVKGDDRCICVPSLLGPEGHERPHP